MYVLVQTVSKHNALAELSSIWYFVDGTFTWSDDPHRAVRMGKKEARYWKGQADLFYGNEDCTHKLMDAREHYLVTRLDDLYTRAGRAKEMGDATKFYDLKRQYIACKGKLKRLKQKLYGNKKLLPTECQAAFRV